MNQRKSGLDAQNQAEKPATVKGDEMPHAIENSQQLSADARLASMHESDEIPLIPWETLAGSHEQLHISFQGKIYHLRVTRNGKLILTK